MSTLLLWDRRVMCPRLSIGAVIKRPTQAMASASLASTAAKQAHRCVHRPSTSGGTAVAEPLRVHSVVGVIPESCQGQAREQQDGHQWR